MVALRNGLLARRRAGAAAPGLDAALAGSGAMPVAGFRPGRLEKARALPDGLDAKPGA